MERVRHGKGHDLKLGIDKARELRLGMGLCLRFGMHMELCTGHRIEAAVDMGLGLGTQLEQRED